MIYNLRAKSFDFDNHLAEERERELVASLILYSCCLAGRYLCSLSIPRDPMD